MMLGFLITFTGGWQAADKQRHRKHRDFSLVDVINLRVKRIVNFAKSEW